MIESEWDEYNGLITEIDDWRRKRVEAAKIDEGAARAILRGCLDGYLADYDDALDLVNQLAAENKEMKEFIRQLQRSARFTRTMVPNTLSEEDELEGE